VILSAEAETDLSEFSRTSIERWGIERARFIAAGSIARSSSWTIRARARGSIPSFQACIP